MSNRYNKKCLSLDFYKPLTNMYILNSKAFILAFVSSFFKRQIVPISVIFKMVVSISVDQLQMRSFILIAFMILTIMRLKKARDVMLENFSLIVV